jgi:hypothetical protein
MSQKNITKESMRLDILLLKQWQANTNALHDALRQAHESTQQDIFNLGNNMAVNLEAMRRILVKAGTITDEDFKLMAQAVNQEVQDAMRKDMEERAVAAAGAPGAVEDDGDMNLYTEGADLDTEPDEDDSVQPGAGAFPA